jgi:predicted nucleic acid-binding protein
VIVVDASLVTKWIVPEDDSALALALLNEYRRRRERVVGPSLGGYEITNVLRQRMRRLGLTEPDVLPQLDDYFALSIEVRPTSRASRERLHRRALLIAAQLALPAAYDAHYVALAEALKCDLWTADERLFRAVRAEFPYVRLLRSYEPAR